MPSDPTNATVRRRAVTAGVGAMVLAALSGCGVRLEEDAPDIPFVPRRTPMPGEPVLLGLMSQTQGLATFVAASADPVPRLLAALHEQQARVLHDAALRGGIPTEVVDSPTPSPTFPAELAAAEGAAATDRSRYGALAPDLSRIVLSLVAQRLAGATLLRPQAPANAPTPPPSPPASPSAAPSASAAAGYDGLLTAGRQASHWLEVAQARAPRGEAATDELTRLDELAAWLRGRITFWDRAVGTNGPEAPVAVPLPFPVVTAEDRTKLVAHALGGIRAAHGRRLAALTGADLAAAWPVLPDELADLEVRLHQWGGALQAFPGLS